jgi:hypothetical protein
VRERDLGVPRERDIVRRLAPDAQRLVAVAEDDDPLVPVTVQVDDERRAARKTFTAQH